ncbi:hypothetical protein Lbir_1736 [Legionella birminghamensis]|uniref:Uncharacterized protein n=1 Tax=Legionella birminghamensis TaxID=28083 RepID=A0A378JZH5_9GAMM|nr:hypothetical protein [Legionella birminghamensis]KTC71482.1 hypothetical protein Lbir_1736 [Legionella birminghamensis]STX60881.1 Uncharacterised protein [Legionella birminghamensis]
MSFVIILERHATTPIGNQQNRRCELASIIIQSPEAFGFYHFLSCTIILKKRISKMKLFKKHPILSIITILILIIVLFILNHNFLIIEKNSQSLEASLLNYVLGIFVSSVFLIIGYIKFDEANRQAKTQNLLRIDERWGSCEIIAAREVIHCLYLDARKIYPDPKHNKQWREIIGEGIKYLHKNEDQVPNFIKLLNFLDFLETIGL